jgi:hypothetical protein
MSELGELRPFLTERERGEMDRLLRGTAAWKPQPRQALAYHCPADILFYGGAAGGGKTDLLLGLARFEHRRSIIFRREFSRLSGIIERSRAFYNPDGDGSAQFSESRYRWRFADHRMIEFGSLQYEHDKLNHQGRPRDFYGFDELPEFSESQFRFVIGWNRTTVRGQRCRVVCTGNPPTDSDGQWIVKYFAPWLDEDHPHPAKDGELRWYTTIKGQDVELPNGEPLEVDGQIVQPVSRTFIRALLEDNAYLLDTGYAATLESMPEPLRSQMRFGDFKAGRQDNAYQVIPSEWVRLAQARWQPGGAQGRRQSALGVDVARGGKDKTTIAPRYDNWFDELRKFPGTTTPDGPAVAALVMNERRDDSAVNIDVISVGTSPYDCLTIAIGDKAVPMNAAEGSEKRDKTELLGFVNQRAEWWWGMREALDPASGQEIALPPDPELKADLCAPKWKLTARGIQIEAKEEIKKRIGRSTDSGDAVVMGHIIKHQPGTGYLDYIREERARIEAEKAAKEKR